MVQVNITSCILGRLAFSWRGAFYFKFSKNSPDVTTSAIIPKILAIENS
jgi:hypothetical protein